VLEARRVQGGRRKRHRGTAAGQTAYTLPQAAPQRLGPA